MTNAHADSSPIHKIVDLSGFSAEDFIHHYANLFIVHDRLMLKAFERGAGAAKALEMHDRVWENPTQPLREIFTSVGATVEDRLVAYTRAFHLHDYYSLRVMREEFGDVDAIEAHHSLWEGQATDTAVVPGFRGEESDVMSWRDLYAMYRAHAAREGLIYDLVEDADDKLVIDSTNCIYFDTISHEVGATEAEEHNHLIAIDSTDRTIEGFFVGIGRRDEFRGVMTRHRCHGDSVCRIEFTRRDPNEPEELMTPVERAGTKCYFCRNTAFESSTQD